MANNFFSKFPTVQYNIDGKGTFLTLTNIAKSVDVNDAVANQSTYYTYYDIADGDRPDTVSFKLYGTPNYHWTLFILNNTLREGLNSAWPLSSNQFEEMLAREYDPYSVITFRPAYDGFNGLGANGLMHLLYGKPEFLPYLRLRNTVSGLSAKILKYDNSLMQLVIHDITRLDEVSYPASIDDFFGATTYKIAWVNPYEVDTDEWVSVESLRETFVTTMFDLYAEFDPAAIIDPTRYEGLPNADAIASAVLIDKTSYVLGKEYIPGPRTMQWASYRNAAVEYYSVDADEIQTSISAYDILQNINVVVPTYYTNFEKEQILNDSKTQIKVIRKEVITDFINAYFSLLNS